MDDLDEAPHKTFSRVFSRYELITGTAALVQEAYEETDREIYAWVKSRQGNSRRLPDYEVTTTFRPFKDDIVMERFVRLVHRSGSVTSLRSVTEAEP